MKICIAGSRDYPNLRQVGEYVETLPHGTDVIQGEASGVDQEAARVALRTGRLNVIGIPAQWSRWGKQAGVIRNATMVDEADRVVVFWDGESKGAKHTIDLALQKRKPLEVYFP